MIEAALPLMPPVASTFSASALKGCKEALPGQQKTKLDNLVGEFEKARAVYTDVQSKIKSSTVALRTFHSQAKTLGAAKTSYADAKKEVDRVLGGKGADDLLARIQDVASADTVQLQGELSSAASQSGGLHQRLTALTAGHNECKEMVAEGGDFMNRVVVANAALAALGMLLPGFAALLAAQPYLALAVAVVLALLYPEDSTGDDPLSDLEGLVSTAKKLGKFGGGRGKTIAADVSVSSDESGLFFSMQDATGVSRKFHVEQATTEGAVANVHILKTEMGTNGVLIEFKGSKNGVTHQWACKWKAGGSAVCGTTGG